MIARHRLVALGLLWAFAVTLGRGLRQPNDWAEAHWLISYAFGPIKRGLPATLLRPFIAARPERAESAITIVATALTLSLCVVLVLLCWNLLRRANFSGNTVTTVAAFVTSPFVVMSGHLNGYFDAPIILLSRSAGTTASSAATGSEASRAVKILNSASASAYPMCRRIAKRSSCTSGSG